MSARLDAAVAELVDALRAELATEPVGPAPDRLLSISQAAEALGIGRTLAYRELDAGRLKSIHVGRRRLVPASSLTEYTGRP